MRADRLVATLLLLQARGTVTAREVAEELEVSERTARRDLDALAVAGIPVYARRGRGGGWQLIGGARTDLTGMRSAEARALLTMAAAAGQATPEFGSAVRKLTQALPEPIRRETETMLSALVADDARWGNRGASILHESRRDEWLDPLQRAVIERRVLRLTYDTPRKGVSQRRIEPLGLVVKAGSWYVVAGTEAGRRTFRVDRIVALDADGEFFEPPPDFDLASEWEAITTGYIEQSLRVTTEAVIDDWTIPALRAMGVETVVHGPAPGRPDRSTATLGGWSADVLAAEMAGLIGGIELIDPPDALTRRLAEIGDELVGRFGRSGGGSGHRAGLG